MDRRPFPLALANIVILGSMTLSGIFESAKYGLQQYGSGKARTNTTSALIQTSDNRYVDTHGQFLDYWGRSIDTDHLVDPLPATTSEIQPHLPLTVTFGETPSTPTSTDVSTTPPSAFILTPSSQPSSHETIPAPVTLDLPKVEIFLIFIETILKLRWSSSFSLSGIFDIGNATPIGVIPRVWSILWLVAYQLASKIFYQALTYTFQHLHITRDHPQSVPEDQVRHDEAASRAEWQAAEKRRLRCLGNARIRNMVAKEKRRLRGMTHAHIKETAAKEKRVLHGLAHTYIKNTLTKEKAKMHRKTSRKANMRSKQLQTLANANAPPDFGPSLANAQYEIQKRMGRFCNLIVDKREEIIAIFEDVLLAYARSVAAEESRPEGRNTRYFSLIEEQGSMIEELRVLLRFRDERIREEEEYNWMLSRVDIGGNPVPKPIERPQFTPVNGPVALSMAVSISPKPFYNRQNPILSADPNWQRFLDSIGESRVEQEERLKPCELDFDEEDVFQTAGAGAQTGGSSTSEQSETGESRDSNADDLLDEFGRTKNGKVFVDPFSVTRPDRERERERLVSNRDAKQSFAERDSTPAGESEETPSAIVEEDGDAVFARQLQEEDLAAQVADDAAYAKVLQAEENAVGASIRAKERAEPTTSNEATNEVPQTTATAPNDGTKPQGQYTEADVEDDIISDMTRSETD